MSVAAIIPALNEAPTVGDVVDAARESVLVDEVVVVDGGSTDDTARVAEEHGARVVRDGSGGKGEAMTAGVLATDADVVVFLDGDLLGLTTAHVDALLGSVVKEGAGMACGLFDRGPVLNPVFLHALPILTGERALRREIFESLDPEDVKGYKVEAALNARCAELDVPVVAFVCDGMWHRTKEKKYSNPVVGYAHKVGMLGTAMWSYASYWGRRRLRRRSRARVRGPS